jgi:hypothetical protein
MGETMRNSNLFLKKDKEKNQSGVFFLKKGTALGYNTQHLSGE